MSEFTKGEITVTTPFSLIDNEIFEAKGRLVAKCWRKDVAEILLNILNSQPDLLKLCEEFMEKADNGAADFDDPEPGSIYLRAEATIAKAKKG